MGPEEFPCHCWHLRDDGAARPLLLLLALGKAQTLLTKYNPGPGILTTTVSYLPVQSSINIGI